MQLLSVSSVASLSFCTRGAAPSNLISIHSYGGGLRAFPVQIKRNSESRVVASRASARYLNNHCNDGGNAGGGGGDNRGRRLSGRGDRDEPNLEGDGFRWWKVYTAVGVLVLVISSQRTYSRESEGELRSKKVVVIIPAFNEEGTIATTVKSIAICQPMPHRVIVVDGGSTDNTISEAKAAGAEVIKSTKKGRAVQSNLGAERAIKIGADVLCFVHADTFVPPDYIHLCLSTLAKPGTVCGAFTPYIAYESKSFWLCSFHNTIKSYYGPLLLRPFDYIRGLRCFFGDQAMTMRAEDFTAIGGFDADLVIMEDADLCVRLHEYGRSKGRGRLRLNDRVVFTSGRRIAAIGQAKATAIFSIIGFGWFFGIRSDNLRRLYKWYPKFHF